MPTFLLEALTATLISVVVKLISRKFFSNDNHINYHPQTTEDEIVIVADTHANKLFKFSNYI